MNKARFAAVVLAIAALWPSAAEAQYKVRGKVKGPDGKGLGGITMVFARADGTGTAPESVVTSAKGKWTQRGFETGVEYTVTPTRGGFMFNPASRQVQRAGKANFTSEIDPTTALWVEIPAGSFDMGCTSGDQDCEARESPVHSVDVPAFVIMGTVATNAQYQACVDATECDAVNTAETAQYLGDDALGDAYPIVNLSDREAQKFCTWISGGRRFGGRLASEAEWEYAARGGRDTWRYPWGNNITQRHANYVGMGATDQWPNTSPVASFRANGYGLYDMVGNVWEFVEDLARRRAGRRRDRRVGVDQRRRRSGAARPARRLLEQHGADAAGLIPWQAAPRRPFPGGRVPLREGSRVRELTRAAVAWPAAGGGAYSPPTGPR